MQNQYNKIFIFFTFRGQLMLMLAFISINLFNGVNYAYAEGSNALGEYVGLVIKIQEDPNFLSQTAEQKAYQLQEYYKERSAFRIYLEKPLFIFNSNHIEETRPMREYILEIVSSDLDRNNKLKLVQMFIELNKLELKYMYAGIEHYNAMVNDVYSLYVDPLNANAWDYVDLKKHEGPIIFQDELMKLYFATKGNPIVLEALTVYRQNTMIYNQFLHNIPFTYEQEMESYHGIRCQLRAAYAEAQKSL